MNYEKNESETYEGKNSFDHESDFGGKNETTISHEDEEENESDMDEDLGEEDLDEEEDGEEDDNKNAHASQPGKPNQPGVAQEPVAKPGTQKGGQGQQGGHSQQTGKGQQSNQNQQTGKGQQGKQTGQYGEQDEQSAKQGQHGQEPSGKGKTEVKGIPGKSPEKGATKDNPTKSF
jgi:hypothetical protein